MRAASMVILGALVVACAPPSQDAADSSAATRAPAVTAAELDVGPVLTPEAYLAEPGFAAADLERGETLSLACIACHTLRPGEDHMLGPNLGNLFGAAAASKPGFMYSAALSESGLIWTPRALDAWLAAPASSLALPLPELCFSGVVPAGTSMVFAGFASAEDRRDLIAYLLRATEVGRD